MGARPCARGRHEAGADVGSNASVPAEARSACSSRRGGRRSRSGARCRGVRRRVVSRGPCRLHGVPHWFGVLARRSSPRPVPAEERDSAHWRNADALRLAIAGPGGGPGVGRLPRDPYPSAGSAARLFARSLREPPRSTGSHSSAARDRNDGRPGQPCRSGHTAVGDGSRTRGPGTRPGHEGLDAVPGPADTCGGSRPTASAGFRVVRRLNDCPGSASTSWPGPSNKNAAPRRSLAGSPPGGTRANSDSPWGGNQKLPGQFASPRAARP